MDEIANAIAKRDKARIVPTGLHALNRLGLSTQVPMNFVYLTDGTPRRIKTGKGKGILFKHTAPKNLAFQNELAMLITFALKEITRERVAQEQLDKIKSLLQQAPKEQIMNDAKLMPAWIKSLIMKMYE
jgi:recombinational DNA repair protein (RecF pathway)